MLLLDTAFAAAPIYDSLVRAGHDVWVMGNRANDLLAKKREQTGSLKTTVRFRRWKNMYGGMGWITLWLDVPTFQWRPVCDCG